MHSLNMNDMTQLLMNLIFYFIIGLFGAFVKDLYDTITQKDRRIRIGRILIGSIWTGFLFIFLDSTWLSNMSVNVIVFLAFLSGILGFELFGRISTLAGFAKTAETAMKLKKAIKIDLSGLTDEDNTESDTTPNVDTKEEKEDSVQKKRTNRKKKTE